MKEKAQYQKKLGNHLKKVLKRKGISPAELCKRTFIEQSHMSRLIKGGNNPTFYTIINICNALNISVEEFFKDFDQ